MNAAILLGPPGAGKGIQAIHIDGRLSIPVISIGEIFRSSVAEGIEIGKQAKPYMDRGGFAPSSVTSTMVKARLSVPDAAQSFLLDSYPHNVKQARVLTDFYEKLDTHIEVVLEIQVNEDEVIARMLKRAEEQHQASNSEPIMHHRFEVCREQIESVASLYADLGLFRAASGSGSVDEVSGRILAVLDARLGH